MARDSHSLPPGPRWESAFQLVEAHHIDEYGRDQGNTDYDNMILFCKYHHFMVHEGGYRIVGTPPDIVILPPEEKNLPPMRNGPPPLTDRVREEFEREFRESSALDDPSISSYSVFSMIHFLATRNGIQDNSCYDCMKT